MEDQLWWSWCDILRGWSHTGRSWVPIPETSPNMPGTPVPMTWAGQDQGWITAWGTSQWWTSIRGRWEVVSIAWSQLLGPKDRIALGSRTMTAGTVTHQRKYLAQSQCPGSRVSAERGFVPGTWGVSTLDTGQWQCLWLQQGLGVSSHKSQQQRRVTLILVHQNLMTCLESTSDQRLSTMWMVKSIRNRKLGRPRKADLKFSPNMYQLFIGQSNNLVIELY